MRGVSKNVIWYTFGILFAIIILVVLFFIFSRSDCDELAITSANEIKAAIECAANYNIDPDTGMPCEPEARVKFCQENRWSLFGTGFIQAYMGLMVPEYMIYYKEFPKEPVESIKLIGGATLEERITKGHTNLLQFYFSESYPFERSYVGQRPWDIRPTLTEFKEFYKTKYLLDPCTSENALCLNIRGREEVIKINAPEITNVRLKREGCYGEALTNSIVGCAVVDSCIAETDPTFYMASPCHAQIKFKREGSTVYAESIDFKSVNGNSNYCYATEDTLRAFMALYSAELNCYCVDFLTDVLSAGTKAGAKQAVKTASKEGSNAASKQVLSKAIAKAAAKGAGKRLGIPSSKNSARVWLTTAGIVPCVDADWCRGLASCGEALMWPGQPFSETTAGDFVGGKSYQTASEVFVDCCTHIIYGSEKNISKIVCSEPSDKVDLMKSELDKNKTDNIYMRDLTDYLGIPYDRAEVLCSLTEGDLSKTCYDSMEAKAKGYEGEDWCGFENNTYDFNRKIETDVMTVSVRTYEYACTGTVTALISNDTDSWEIIDERTMEHGKDVQNSYNIELDSKVSFQYLRLQDSSNCIFDYTGIVISPYAHDVIEVVPNKRYEIDADRFTYFLTPEGYSETAANLCAGISFCDTISKYDEIEGKPLKYFKEAGARTDFHIGANQRIGILPTEDTIVYFQVNEQ